jgi:hypothetical protein
MQLKGRVARFSKSAASGVAITKIGMIAFSPHSPDEIAILSALDAVFG